MTITQELIETLKAASNYVDTLGGNSIRYRQVIAKAESAVSEPVGKSVEGEEAFWQNNMLSED